MSGNSVISAKEIDELLTVVSSSKEKKSYSFEDTKLQRCYEYPINVFNETLLKRVCKTFYSKTSNLDSLKELEKSEKDKEDSLFLPLHNAPTPFLGAREVRYNVSLINYGNEDDLIIKEIKSNDNDKLYIVSSFNHYKRLLKLDEEASFNPLHKKIFDTLVVKEVVDFLNENVKGSSFSYKEGDEVKGLSNIYKEEEENNPLTIYACSSINIFGANINHPSLPLYFIAPLSFYKKCVDFPEVLNNCDSLSYKTSPSLVHLYRGMKSKEEIDNIKVGDILDFNMANNPSPYLWIRNGESYKCLIEDGCNQYLLYLDKEIKEEDKYNTYILMGTVEDDKEGIKEKKSYYTSYRPGSFLYLVFENKIVAELFMISTNQKLYFKVMKKFHNGMKIA